MKCPYCNREIHRLEKVNLYKTQMGFYELRNGDYAFIHGFGTYSGWGIRVSDIDSNKYTWLTKTGVCTFRNGEKQNNPDRDIVAYVGHTLPKELKQESK